MVTWQTLRLQEGHLLPGLTGQASVFANHLEKLACPAPGPAEGLLLNHG